MRMRSRVMLLLQVGYEMFLFKKPKFIFYYFSLYQTFTHVYILLTPGIVRRSF